MPVSGPLLCEKVNQFHRQLHPEEEDSFKASIGWLWRFCNRHGMRLLGDKLSADFAASDPFQSMLDLMNHVVSNYRMKM